MVLLTWSCSVASASQFSIDVVLEHWISSGELSIELLGKGIEVTSVKSAQLHHRGADPLSKQTWGERTN